MNKLDKALEKMQQITNQINNKRMSEQEDIINLKINKKGNIVKK